MIDKKKYKINFTFPNLNTIPQRGNLSIRKQKIRNLENKIGPRIKFSFVEIPADFIKNETESKKAKLGVGGILSSKSEVESIYSIEDKPSNRYILHTEPSLPRTYMDGEKKKTVTPKLCWHDPVWLNQFINQISLIFDYFKKPSLAIEIHPGVSNRNNNTLTTFSKAIDILLTRIKSNYNYYPLIMIENRTGHIIKDGISIFKFWNHFKRNFDSISSYIGIILDIQQFYTVTKENFRAELDKIPKEVICGAHIHTKHQSPSLDDSIPWQYVFEFLRNVNKKRDLYILPEVHNEKNLLSTIDFIEAYL